MRSLPTWFILLIFAFGASQACTQKQQPKKKENTKKTGDSAGKESGDPDSSARSQGGGDNDPEAARKRQEAQDNQRLIGDWNGKEDKHPTGLFFVSRAFKQGGATATPSPTPGGAGAGAAGSGATATFTQLTAAFQTHGCLGQCHVAGGSATSQVGGQRVQLVLNNHAAMVTNGAPAAWVSGAAASVTGGRMPKGRRQLPNRAQMAADIDAKFKAWQAAGYPQQ